MRAALDDLGRTVIPEKAQKDDLGTEEVLVMKDGVLLFTGRLEGDPDLVLQEDREERARKVAGMD